jgi:hypothetical protein
MAQFEKHNRPLDSNGQHQVSNPIPQGTKTILDVINDSNTLLPISVKTNLKDQTVHLNSPL